MVDAERVDRLLDRLLADVAALRATASRDLAAEPIAMRALKYDLIVVAEGAARVAQHIVVSEGWPVAESNADAFRRLATEDVVDTAVAESLGRAVGLRNLLVHRYDDVDDERVVASLDRLGDVEAFASMVARWVASGRGHDEPTRLTEEPHD